MLVPKLLLTPIKTRIFGPKMAKFGPKSAFLVILGIHQLKTCPNNMEFLSIYRIVLLSFPLFLSVFLPLRLINCLLSFCLSVVLSQYILVRLSASQNILFHLSLSQFIRGRLQCYMWMGWMDGMEWLSQVIGTADISCPRCPWRQCKIFQPRGFFPN